MICTPGPDSASGARRCRRAPWWRAALGLGLCAAVVLLGGCQQLGWLVQGASRDEVAAVYKLPPRPTLVLVDDPDQLLGDAGLRSVIAARVGDLLVANHVVPRVVDPSVTLRLAQQYGGEYATLAADRLGRALGAEQVVSITIAGATLSDQLDLTHPAVLARVKVIDAVAGQRVFPTPSHSDGYVQGRMGESPGYLVQTQLRPRLNNREVESLMPRFRLGLAQNLGRDIALLFFAHTKPVATGEWTAADVVAP